MDGTSSPPSAAQVAHLRPDGLTALGHVSANLAAFAAALGMSAVGQLWLWIPGQLLLGCAFLHAFILLHEAGHGTLFRQRALNLIAGHIAGFLTLIPFSSWQCIHARHHRYTGWQDLDATTAALVPRTIRPWERGLINTAWAMWIPLFALSYRVQNFWNLKRIARYVTRVRDMQRMRWNVAVLLVFYLSGLTILGPLQVLELAGPGFLISLIAQEALILSQHTHVPQQLSHGARVRPFSPAEQEQFTRSLRLPDWMSTALLHFDAHELHHIYPQVPGYRLRRIGYVPRHEVHWWRWLLAARRMSGTTFLFSNWDHSGIRL